MHAEPTSERQPARSTPTLSGSRYAPGDTVAGKYRLMQPLGEGGMGALWVAHNEALELPVALKLIRSDVAAPDAAERLLTEAQAAARLKHPSIVRIFDFGRTAHGDPFIVMELLSGENLGHLLARTGRLSATYAVQLLLPIAEGLVAAHKHSVVHRDLKPENVFLAQADGRVLPKIVDFGIAKLGRRREGMRLTGNGVVLGSPEYMSPEQAQGSDDIDPRADIWAFCVMLYECVSGRVPFHEPNYNALLRRIIEDPVPSILELEAGDAELWAILERGLRKDRNERWRSARQLGEALGQWLLDNGVSEDVAGHSVRASWLEPARSLSTDVLYSGAGTRSNATLAFGPPATRPRAAPEGVPERHARPRHRAPLIVAAAIAAALLALFGVTHLERMYRAEALRRAAEPSEPQSAVPAAIVPRRAPPPAPRELPAPEPARVPELSRARADESPSAARRSSSAEQSRQPARPREDTRRQPPSLEHRSKKPAGPYEDLGF